LGNACPTCALPLAGSLPLRCASCKRNPSKLTGCVACFAYGGQIAEALRRLKFQQRSDIALSLAPLLQSSFARSAACCDVAVAMPLHRKRLQMRTFNQAQRLLVPLAREAKLPVLRKALLRVRSTPAQSKLTRKERAGNLRSAFYASSLVQGKRVLLLDDICTTGATLHAAAQALHRAGAREIYAFVVARTE